VDRVLGAVVVHRREQDVDDDETLPQARVKLESVEGESRQPQTASERVARGGTTLGQKNQKSKREEVREKAVIGVPCCRSYSIRFGCAGLKQYRKRKADDGAEETSGAVEPHIDFEVVNRASPATGAKRRWGWVNGMMVVKSWGGSAEED